jgi:glycine oxidase
MPEAHTTPETVDVAVIGGGLIGSSIAWRLAESGAGVCLLERGDLGAEASSAAAGMLAPQGELVEPPAFADLCFQSLALYPKFLAEIEALTGESTGYRQEGTLLVGIEEAECRELEEIYETQTKRGLRLERLSGDEVRRRAPGLSPAIPMGLFVPGDHWLNNERLVHGVAKACCRRGVDLRARCEVTGLMARNGRVEALHLRSDGGAVSTLSAGQYVLAAGAWSEPLAASLGIRAPITPCRGQMIEFETPPELPCVVRAGHHYLVPRSPGCMVAGTTAEYIGFEKDVTAEGLRSILNGVMRFAPLVKELRFRRAWAGLRPDTPDHLPVLGYGPLANLIFATGHFRNGILLAPVTAELVSNLVLKRSTNHSLEPFLPVRFAA